MSQSAENDAREALYRLWDQAANTAGDDAGREQALADYLAILHAFADVWHEGWLAGASRLESDNPYRVIPPARTQESAS